MEQKGQLALPAPCKKIPQDAARAVKRKGELTLQSVKAETLNEWLDLPGMRITHFAIETEEEIQYLHLFCAHSHQVAMCPT